MSQATFSSSMTCVFLVAVMLQVGCNRSFYRIQADEEAMAILREKTTDPRWSLPNYAFEPDSRSRMYSPFSQDHPPMPPDDPTAAQFMEVVDGKPGYPHWHANGDTPFVQNPEWQLFLPIEEDGVIRLRMEDAYRLALLHSREYQARNEELYLSALDVSKERFEFESQLFLPTRTSFSSSSISMGETLSLRKAGIAGSSFLVSLANDLVWTFPGSVSPSIGTLFSWSFSQPLLRGAGRDVVLENLTQAERSFLDAIRSLEDTDVSSTSPLRLTVDHICRFCKPNNRFVFRKRTLQRKEALLHSFKHLLRQDESTTSSCSLPNPHSTGHRKHYFDERTPTRIRLMPTK